MSVEQVKTLRIMEKLIHNTIKEVIEEAANKINGPKAQVAYMSDLFDLREYYGKYIGELFDENQDLRIEMAKLKAKIG